MMWTNFYMEVEQTTGTGFLTKEAKDLLLKFLSIFLTALISALITFLQSMLLDPSLAPTGPEAIPQAGATGAILRAVVLAWRDSGIMRA